jgi:GNAT superfamily N-acetyltransferase
MNNTLHFRNATPEDADALIHLTAQLGYACTIEDLLERFIPYQKKTHGIVFVAVLDGTVVGWISLNVVRYFYVQPFIEVSGFVVEEKNRNQGIGKKLLETAESWAKEQGYTLIRIRTNVLRTEAHRFYANNGYKKVKEQKVYLKEIK